MRTNIRQVAALAGVSRTTVSNVLLGKEGRITPEKREKVLQAVEKLGYFPVRPVLQNGMGSTRVLAIALSDPFLAHHDFHSRVYAGICEAALRHDYDILTVLRAEPDWAANRAAVRLLDRRSDGIVFIAPDENNNLTLNALVETGTPTVVTYRRDVPAGVAWVDPDNVAAVQVLANHLLAYGHKKIAFLTYKDATQYDFRMRQGAFFEMTQSETFPQFEGFVIESPAMLTPEMAARIIAEGVTAVICANDYLALELWGIFDEMDVRVPEKISIVGIDDMQPSAWRGLTTMEITYSKVGALAVEALINLINGKAASECCQVVGAQLVERTSVRKLAS